MRYLILLMLAAPAHAITPDDCRAIQVGLASSAAAIGELIEDLQAVSPTAAGQAATQPALTQAQRDLATAIEAWKRNCK